MRETPVNMPWSERSETRIADLVDSAKRKFDDLCPEQDFGAQIWDVGHLSKRPSADSVRHLCFTTLDSNKGINKYSVEPANALPSYYAGVVKSWIVQDSDVTNHFQAHRLLAARYLWDFINTKQPERAKSFRWGSLVDNDLLSFEQYLKAYCSRRVEPLSPDVIWQLVNNVQQLADFLVGRGICRRIRYCIQTTPQREQALQLLDSKERAAAEKLPVPDVLEALASIYHRVTTAPAGTINGFIQILISAIGILMLTGLRIGELVTLPFDCEVEERISGKGRGGQNTYRYGIKYWPEKKRHLVMRVKWISPTAEPIVRAAVARIKSLTQDARERAKVLEADPTRVPLPPEFENRSALTTREVHLLHGPKSTESGSRHQFRKIPHITRKQRSYYNVKDVEAYFLQKRVGLLYTLAEGGRVIQNLSETLLISFVSYSPYKQYGACRLLVTPITVSIVSNSLNKSNKSGQFSIFTQFGTTEEQKLMSANSHSFRHWLNHVAYKGKMPVHLITRYFARKEPRDTRDYLHFTAEETGSYVREEIRAGRVFGTVALTYWSLPPEQREDYLNGQVMVGHFTPWGLCVRNFAVEPCEKHLNCLNNCGSFCSTKGNKGEIKALFDLRAKTKTLLKMAEKAEAEGVPQTKAYVSYHRITLANIRRVLLQHLDKTVEDGIIVRPFEGQPSLHQSSLG